MPIYTDGLRDSTPKTTSYYDGSFGSAWGAGVSEVFDDWSSNKPIGINEINAAHGGARQAPESDALGNPTGEPQAPDETAAAVPQLTADVAKRRIKEAGFEKDITLPSSDTYAAPVVDIMIDRARHRRELAATIAAGPDNVGMSALMLGTSFLVGAIDPINLASAFIPIMGEVRYGKLMASVGESAMRRAAMRTAVGAGQGVVGQALLEPLDYYAHNQEGRDFGMADVLQDLMFGAVLGGGMHAGGGFVSDKLRARKGLKAFPFGPGDVLADFGGTHVHGYALSTDGTTLDNVPDHLVPGRVSPAVAILDDLPPRAREDAMRSAIASLIGGEPVKVGEMLHAAAATDPRIAESFEAFHGPMRPANGPPAEAFAPPGIAEVRSEGRTHAVYVDGEFDTVFDSEAQARRYAGRGAKYDLKVKSDLDHFVDLDKAVRDQHPIVQAAMKAHAADDTVAAGDVMRNHPDKAALTRHLQDNGVHGAKYTPPGSLPDASANLILFNDQHLEVKARPGADVIEPGHLPNAPVARPIRDDVGAMTPQRVAGLADESLSAPGATQPALTQAPGKAARNGFIEARTVDANLSNIPAWDVHPDAGTTPAVRGPDPGQRGDAGLSGQDGRGADGARSRADRIGARAAPEQSWRDLARTSPEFNDPDVLAASRFADLLPEPIKTRLDERVTAALQADADSEKLYDLMKAGLSEADRKLIDDALNDLKLEGKTRDEAIRRGGACLFGRGG